MADKLWTTAWTELAGDAMVDADKISDTSSTNKFTTAGDISKLAGIASGATDDTTVNNHIADTSDAHDASAISVLDTATQYTATDVEAALAEVKVIADAAVTPAEAAAAYQPLDADLTTIAAAANGSVLAATTASFTTTDESKLDGIEALADVTDATNVSAAGAPIISSGSGAPGSTPTKVGDIYIDTTGDDAYIAVGTASSVDWEKTNDGGGGGSVDTSGTPVANDIARFTDADTIEGRSYSELLSDLSLDSSLTTFALPDSTTISAFGATLVDDADATTARSTLGLVIGTNVQAYDADTLKADTADTLTAGFDSSDFAAGTKSTGTYTPAPADGNFQVATNGGAHTLAPPSTSCSIVIHYTNNGSAGAITTSGFTQVTGDAFTTTNTHEFVCVITKINDVSVLNITALQ